MPYRPPIQILHALVTNRGGIQNLIASSVQTAFSMAQARLLNHVGEVEKLIFFFTEGLPLIEHGMNQLLARHGVHVTISGIFCHQTPKVKEVLPVATTSSCELGDIAFLSVYGELMGAPLDGLGNAVLVQAKERFYPGVSSVQERLYQDVERFEYTSPNPLTGQTRSLVQSTGCLYYWDFNNWHRRWSTEAVLARPLWPTGHIVFPFERMLTDLFCGANGRGVQAQPAGDGWGRLIHDLIQNSATRALRHGRIFCPHQPRPGRIFNYPLLVPRHGPAPSFVRCSLGEFLKQFDAEVAEAGARLEQEAHEYDLPEGKEDPPGGEVPPLSRDSDNDGDGGAGSFIVFQFSEGPLTR